ncbi:dTDP-4-dehydrorhamnose 3,5-epimerase family protein [Streptomyces argenteolus]|uniref:dTDP-4-dehydrorhamnose 3,5-epimerase family protein n=1 Tax=Streptomyces argenteolus TaxID=67274 RepID=A0ABW6X315_9ACTN
MHGQRPLRPPFAPHAFRHGALRAIHYAGLPPGRTTYVTCLRGAVLDAAADLRIASPHGRAPGGGTTGRRRPELRRPSEGWAPERTRCPPQEAAGAGYAPTHPGPLSRANPIRAETY